MKMTVGTTPTLVDTSDAYPDRGATGQTVMVQNLGPGLIYADFSDDPSEGIQLATGDAWEFSRATRQELYVVSSAPGTDVRVVVVG